MGPRGGHGGAYHRPKGAEGGACERHNIVRLSGRTEAHVVGSMMWPHRDACEGNAVRLCGRNEKTKVHMMGHVERRGRHMRGVVTTPHRVSRLGQHDGTTQSCM